MQSSSVIGRSLFPVVAMMGLAVAVAADDLVVVTDDTGRVFVTFGDGTGTFSPLLQVDDMPGANARGTAVADFDQDGVADFITGDNANSQISPYFFKGNADNTFQPRVVLAPTPTGGGYFMDAAAGDFDGDSNPDFICGGNNSNQGFYWGNGDGTFVQELRTLNSNSRGMDAGDFNGDGALDFIRGSNSNGFVRLYLGNSTRVFTEAPAIAGDAGADPYGVVAGDFDCDGVLDVLANEGGSGDYTFFGGNGDGTFRPGSPRADLDVNNYNAADALDFDRDGALDVVMTTYSSRFNYLFRGRGNGTFQARVALPGQPPGAALGLAAGAMPAELDVRLDPPSAVLTLGTPLALTVLGTSVDDAHAFSWAFGDGNTATGRSVSHTYVAEGVFSCVLTHTNAAGRKTCRFAPVTVLSVPPVARPGGPYAIPESAANLNRWTATLDGSTSSDDFAVVAYEWDFGDATTGTGAKPVHTWNGRGPWTVTLTVTDISGQKHTATTQVTTSPGAPPVPKIVGPAILDETAAQGGVWSATFASTGTTDDVRIWKYLWNFGNGLTSTATGASTTYNALNTYRVSLQVWDHADQVSEATLDVLVRANDPPVARIDIDKTLLEGAEPFRLSAAQSTDDVGIYDYTWLLPAREFPLHGAAFDSGQWAIAPGRVTQLDRFIVNGEIQRAWGVNWFFSLGTLVRRGATLELRVDTPNTASNAMVGFKNLNPASGHYNQLIHAIYFNDGRLQIYQNGGQAQSNVGTYIKGTSYDVRIGSKLTGGATYDLRASGTGAEYMRLWESSNLVEPEMGFGADVNSGVFGFDDIRVDQVIAHGREITASTAADGTVTLVVRDHALQASSDTVAVTRRVDQPPTAGITADSVGVVGSSLHFSGAPSRDDHGIASYEWTFGDGSAAGAVGDASSTTHFYGAPGDYTVTLTVRDYAGQFALATHRITITGEGLVKAVPWRFLGGIELPHEIWSGGEAVLKAVAGAAKPPVNYVWDFGDGSPTVAGTAATTQDAYRLEAKHVYTGNDGTPFTATISITDADGKTGIDTYPLVIRTRTIEVEMNVAIDSGLWYLHKTQVHTVVDGSFRGGQWLFGSYAPGPIASAVQAFAINGHLLTSDSARDPYVETVERGMRSLWSTVEYLQSSPQPAGEPDVNANGIVLGLNSPNYPYQLGQVMDAIVAAGRPDLVTDVGQSNVRGRPYGDLIEDMAEAYFWGQSDNPAIGGGWRYFWHQGPDNSASQWAAIGLIPAESLWGVQTPGWVKEQNRRWLEYSKSANGFGYTGPGSGEALTPSGMVQLAWLGVPTSDILWRQGEDYLGRTWTTIIRNNNFYTYYAIAKALRLAQPTPVTRLASTQKDWFLDPVDGLARTLVNRQRPTDGSWLSGVWLTGDPAARPYSTAWAVIILSSTLFQRAPVAVVHTRPNPGAVGGEIIFDGTGSFHQVPAFDLVDYRWDFDAANGINFDTPDAVGPRVTATYGALGVYTATLQVRDNATPPNFDTATVEVRITIPPHPPTADAGGPYVAAVGETLVLDGSGSFDIDADAGDEIQSWDWELDFAQPLDFDDGFTGETPTWLAGFDSPGQKNIALRVKDRTATVFPQAGSPNLTDDDFTTVTVYSKLIDDLVTRAKDQKIQLTWTHRYSGGNWRIHVLRSAVSPSRGFETIAVLDGRPTAYIDRSIALQRRYFYRLLAFLQPLPGSTVGAPLGGSCAVAVTSSPRDLDRNHPPVITTAPVLEALAENPYRYDVDAVDPEGNALTFVLAAGPDGMDIDASSGVISWTPTPAQLGPHDVLVEARDAQGSAGTQLYQVVVSPRPNAAPVARANSPRTTLRGQPVAFSSAGSSDPDDDPLTYTWSFGDGSTVEAQNPVHTYTASGVYAATLIVRDGRGGVASDSTAVQVDTPNRPPTARVAGGSSFRTRVGLVAAFDGSSSFDLDGDPLSFQWSWGDSTPAASGASATHSYTSEGVFLGALTVLDGRGGVGVHEFRVTVGAANRLPVAAFDITRAGINPGDELVFDGSASLDPDGDSLLLSWDFGDGLNTTGITVTHVFRSGGNFEVRLTARDSFGGEGTATKTVAINSPPVITTSPVLTATEDQLYQYDVNATDANGEIITYRLRAEPSGMTIDATSGLIRWTPNSGGYTTGIIVDAVDPRQGTSSQAFEIVVQSVNDAPVITSTAVVKAVVARAYSYQATVEDEENDALSFSLTVSPPGMTVGSTSGLVAWTPAAGQVGNQPVTLRVFDGTSAVTQSYSVQVLDQSRPPVITSTAVTNALEDAPYSYQVRANDPDGTPLVHSLELAPAGMTINAANGLIGWLPRATDVGAHPVRVRVSDDLDPPAVQSFSLNVVEVNDAPEIVSQPPTAAEPNFAYAYRVVARDEERDAITFTLERSPAGMTIHATQGIVSWTPTPAQLGDHGVTVKATDSRNGMITQAFTINVAVRPHAPEVASIPDQVTQDPTPFATLRLDEYVNDADHADSELRWTATGQRVIKVTIDGNRVARLEYTPGARLTERVTFTATDPGGLTGATEVAFTVAAPSSDKVPPVLSLVASPRAVAVGTPATILIEAEDNEGIASVQAFAGGTLLPLANQGGGKYRTQVVQGAVGFVKVSATVRDLAGNSFSDELEIFVFDPAISSDVQVAITAPAEDALLKAPTDVVGSAFGAGFADHVLEYAPQGTDAFTVFGGGREPVSNGVLGTLDPTALADGFYVLRLSARGFGGDVARIQTVVEVAGPKIGPFTLTFSDKTLNVGTVPISMSRTYDSRDKTRGDFGYGWRISLGGIKLVENRSPGTDWEQVRGGGVFPVFALLPTKDHKATIFLGDGQAQKLEFTARPSPRQQVLQPLIILNGMDYVPVGATRGTLVPSEAAEYVVGQEGPAEITNSSLTTYNPAAFTYTDVQGNKFVLRESARNSLRHNLTAITDTHGTTITLATNGILRSDGRSLGFQRDAQGRVTRLECPDGREILYDYDVRGDLAAVTDEAGNTTRFSYDNRHNLIAIHDPLGNRVIRTEYDAAGHILSTTDADGKRIEFTHNIAENEELVRTRSGSVRRFTYDQNGNVLTSEASVTVGGEVETHLTSYTYDSAGRQTSLTDPLGRTATWVYDANGNVTRYTDLEGNQRTFTYNANGQVLTSTEPNGNVSSNTFDAKGNQTQSVERDSQGRLLSQTDYTYDAKGNPTTEAVKLNATESDVTTNIFDAAGNRVGVRNALGHEVGMVVDSSGRMLAESTTRTRADGSLEVLLNEFAYGERDQVTLSRNAVGAVTEYTYNLLGKLDSVTDAVGRKTTHEYDAQGRSIRVNGPGGRFEEAEYDVEGNRVVSRDTAGRVTVMEYDELGRHVRTILPDETPDQPGDNPTVEISYDAIGRVVRRKEADGSTLTYAYEPRTATTPRLKRTTDGLGNTAVEEFDVSGNVTRTVDPLGRVSRFEFDAASRLTRTIFPDGTSASSEYDLAGRKIAHVDAAGNRTAYRYDVLGRLLAVSDPAGNETTYRYDELGKLVEHTDALGRKTRFEYDAAGRRTARVLPMGQREVVLYDALGNVLRKTDFNGQSIVYEYDDLGQLVAERYADRTATIYEYNLEGQLTLVRDARGETHYQYDALGRLLERVDPDGSTLSYQYDAFGRIITVQTPAGRTTNTYDAVGRLASVRGPDGGTTTYAYDRVGNHTRIAYPGGVATTYTHDAMNRVTRVENRGTGGLLAQFDHTYNALGQRTQMVETGSAIAARTANYTFDVLGRLTSESIDLAGTANDQTTTYQFDAVNNRLRREVVRGAQRATTTYRLDDNDRLLEETTSTTVAMGPGGHRGDRGEQPLTAVAWRPPASLWSLGLYLLVLATACLGLAWPLTQVIHRRQKLRLWERRALLHRGVALLLIPLFFLGPSTLHALGVQGGLYLATVTSVGQVSPGTIRYSYDPQGNTLSRSDGLLADRYTYDQRGRLVAAEVQMTGAPASLRYAYDHSGNRTARTVNGVTTNYLVDYYTRAFPSVVQETTGTHQVSYVHGNDIVGMTRPVAEGGTSYFLSDGTFSTRLLASSTGQVSDTFSYDAHGNSLGRTGTTPNDYLYRGEPMDAQLGLQYLRDRYYSPANGRFHRMDGYEGSFRRPATLHKYTYGHADPVNNFDPSGQSQLADVMASMAIRAALFSIGTAFLLGGASAGTGGSFIPDAAVWGIGVSVGIQVKKLSLSTNSAVAILDKYLDLLPWRGPYIKIFSKLDSVLGYLTQSGLGAAGTLSASAELLAIARPPKEDPRQAGTFVSAGGGVATGPGSTGVSVTFYSGVVWNVTNLDSYRSFPMPTFSLGGTIGLPSGLGFTHTFFLNPSGPNNRPQYGQWSGLTLTAGGAKPSAGGGAAFSEGPLQDFGFDRRLFNLAWPPPFGTLLWLKARRR